MITDTIQISWLLIDELGSSLTVSQPKSGTYIDGYDEYAKSNVKETLTASLKVIPTSMTEFAQEVEL